MKISAFELEPWEKEYLGKKFSDISEITFYQETLSEKNVSEAKDSEAIVIFIYSKITSEILNKLPKLKFIATMSTGFDHIDIEECKKRNIIVSTVPSYGENTVAEHAFALIFAISRRLIESYERVKEGNFSPEGLTGFDLYGKTLGVVGVGKIGCHAIRIAKGIGMDVLGYKRTPDDKLARDLGFQFTDIDTLLSQSDIITVHLPYTPETHHFIDREKFEKMKKGMIVINTSRGAIIDTKALVEALENGIVASAGLDVLEGEPLLREEKEVFSKHLKKEELMQVLEDHMLLQNHKVIITPHNAFNSSEALERILKTTQENLLGFMANSPKNLAF